MVRAVLAPSIEMETDVGTPPVPVAMDQLSLERLLLNLILNGADAMPEGERLRTPPLRASTDAPQAPVRSDTVQLEVSDDGRGMDPDTRRRAFAPEFSTRPGGLGLGLSTVAALVESSGGSLEFDSGPRRSTRVRLVLSAT